MRHIGLSFTGRVRAAFIGGVAVLLATASLAAPVLAADQPTTTAQTPDTNSPQAHQIHGVVKGTPASGATTFVVTTERYADVTVTFTGATIKGRGHAGGHARSFEVGKASDLKDGDRVVVQGHFTSDNTFVARRVHLLPAKGAAAHTTHLVGTVTFVASGSNGTTTLTLSPTEGR